MIAGRRRKDVNRLTSTGERRARPSTGNSRHREHGQALMIFALGLAVLLGFAALTTDVGLAYVERREMQNAADAAALAGGDTLMETAVASEAEAAALKLAASNGYDNADPDVSVAAHVPPTSGPHVGDSDYIEVIIKNRIDLYLARTIGKSSWGITARAVAEINRSPKPFAIIALNETACDAMQFEGQVNVSIADAGTLTNSECVPNAFSTDGGVTIDTWTNAVVGGWTISGGSGDISPRPSPAGHFADPLAAVPAPNPTAGPVRTCPTFGGGGAVGAVETLHPGVYDCTIDPPGDWGLDFKPGDYHITGGIVLDGGGTATFGKGLYFLQGKGLIITGHAAVTANGVTFYIDEGQVLLTGTGDTVLTAPQTGTYAGIAIFQNRSLTTTVEFSGEAVADGWGAIYAQSAQIHLTGNATSTFHQFISDTFLIDGNSNISIEFSGGVLVEVPVLHLVE
jgi:hypothetical protein